MSDLGRLVQIGTQMAVPTTIGDVTVTPRSWSLVVRLPFGGFVWHRPVGVLVQRGESVDYLPIHDRTQRIQLACIGALVAAFLVSRLVQQMRKEKA
jgi:hypothetical protein